MNSFKKFRAIGTLAMLVGATCGGLRASNFTAIGTITLPAQFATAGSLDFCSGGTLGNFNTPGCTFVLPDFALPAGDTLTAVLITFTWNASTTITLTNYDYAKSKEFVSGANAGVSTDINVNLVKTDGTAVAGSQDVLLPTTGGQSFCVGKNCPDNGTSTSGETLVFGPYTGSASSILTLTDAGVLSSLTSGGYVTLGAFTQTGLAYTGQFHGSNDYSNTQSTTGSATASIEYDYSGATAGAAPYMPGAPSAAPEPASMGLIGSALISLAVLGKKYTRRRG